VKNIFVPGLETDGNMPHAHRVLDT